MSDSDMFYEQRFRVISLPGGRRFATRAPVITIGVGARRTRRIRSTAPSMWFADSRHRALGSVHMPVEKLCVMRIFSASKLTNGSPHGPVPGSGARWRITRVAVVVANRRLHPSVAATI